MVHTNQRKTDSESSKALCIFIFTLDYISAGKRLTIPGSGGVFIAGDPEINPIYHQLVDFTSTVDDVTMLLSWKA